MADTADATTDGPILHITTAEAWDHAQQTGRIHPPSLDADGFAHCCTTDQVAAVLDRFYPERGGLVILSIDVAQLGDTVVWEAPAHPDGSPNDSAEAAQRFPHVYGAIPVRAVGAVIDATNI